MSGPNDHIPEYITDEASAWSFLIAEVTKHAGQAETRHKELVGKIDQVALNVKGCETHIDHLRDQNAEQFKRIGSNEKGLAVLKERVASIVTGRVGKPIAASTGIAASLIAIVKALEMLGVIPGG